jgi:transcriptional regulator with XRE-family HTH domain
MRNVRYPSLHGIPSLGPSQLASEAPVAKRTRIPAADDALADAVSQAVSQAIARSSAEFFRRLVEALAERGLATTRTALAGLLNVRPTTIAAWAQGKATPAIDGMLRLARAGGMDFEQLFALAGGVPRDPEVQELLERFESLSAEGRAFVLEAARHAPRARRSVRPRRSKPSAAAAARTAKSRRPR